MVPFRRVLGWVAPILRLDGALTRLILYGDGEAYLESLDRGYRLGHDDPPHPLHALFDPRVYLEQPVRGGGA